MTDVEIQRMRANVFRDEVLDSHAVIEQRDATIAIYRTMIDDLSAQNRALKGELARIEKMLVEMY